MKSFIAIIAAAVILAGCAANPSAVSASAANSSSALMEAYQDIVPLPGPVLVTSFGQSPDSMVAKGMFSNIGVDFTFDTQASPEVISEYKSVVIVVGTSIKSLISVGIDPQNELERCRTFAENIPDDLPVVVLRMGSSQTQTDFSENIISIAVQPADIVVVTKSGDDGNHIQKAAEELSKNYYKCSNVKDVESFLSEIFSKK